MRIATHPSEQLEKDIIDRIHSLAGAAEEVGQLQEAQLAVAYEQQWFTMLAPKVYGGAELALPRAVRLEEAIAWVDGSMGWVVTLCAGAGWFGGFMLPEPAAQVFAEREACLAGSGAATGTAERVPEGYRVSGKWWHASGAPHNTVFTANCVVTEHGQPVIDDAGDTVIRPFAFFRNEVSIIHTWKSFGLVATASHAFEINELIVPANRGFSLEAGSALIDVPLYHYPFLQLAEVTLAANISGMCIHFLDLASASVIFKRDAEQPVLQKVIDEATLSLQQVRQSFYAVLDVSWQELLNEFKVTPETLTALSSTARALAKQSRHSVESVYPYCGLPAAATDAEMNRVWRDIHTASQHSLLVYPRN